jgi:hypothetical protein
VGTVVGAVVPAPDGTQSIWVDQPIANSTIASGSTAIVAHASYQYVTSFRFVVRKNGQTVKVLNDTTPLIEKKDKSNGFGQLASAEVSWTPVAGVYTIEPRYISGGEWIKGTPVTVTVLDTPEPDAEKPTEQPTEAPTSEPTAVPTQEPSEAATAGPSTSPVSTPPPATPTPVAPQMPTGTIQRIATNDSHVSNYNVYGITPEFVDVDVQVRYSTTGAWSSWASLGCSDLAPEIWSTAEHPSFTCQVNNHIWGWSTSGRQAQVRAVITNYDDESLVYTTNTVSWSVFPDIG